MQMPHARLSSLATDVTACSAFRCNCLAHSEPGAILANVGLDEAACSFGHGLATSPTSLRIRRRLRVSTTPPPICSPVGLAMPLQCQRKGVLPLQQSWYEPAVT